jgi:hypothetical protein
MTANGATVTVFYDRGPRATGLRRRGGRCLWHPRRQDSERRYLALSGRRRR